MRIINAIEIVLLVSTIYHCIIAQLTTSILLDVLKGHSSKKLLMMGR